MNKNTTKKVDLSKLHTEIASRKTVSNANGVAPRNKFLYELNESLRSGRETQSTALIKKVDNEVSTKLNEKPRFVVNEDLSNQPVVNHNTRNVGDANDRDELFWREFENRKKFGLADELEKHSQSAEVFNPNMNHGKSLVLNEEIKKGINTYLQENFNYIVEDAIKNTILELYTVERIKDVLIENDEIIKKMVINTIKELQNKSKKNV